MGVAVGVPALNTPANAFDRNGTAMLAADLEK